jgi:hypothetical protein
MGGTMAALFILMLLGVELVAFFLCRMLGLDLG